MDVKDARRDEDFDRLLILLASVPRPGFEEAYDELTRREVDRLLRPTDDQEPDRGE